MTALGDFNWLQLFAAALGGGLTVKLVDILYQEFRRRLDSTDSAKRFVDTHLDPLLKAADELVGKMVSLANEDFSSLPVSSAELSHLDNDVGGLLYLFGRFWARVEIIRQEGLTVAIASDKRGAQLQSFLACLESRRVRLVDRISQRAMGELFLRAPHDHPQTIGYVEFVRLVESDKNTHRWIAPLANVLSSVRHTAVRQHLLQYGIVLHALIDTLDPNHWVTSSRPSYPNKLSNRTRSALRYRVFKVYLSFVKETPKYIWSTKKAHKG